LGLSIMLNLFARRMHSGISAADTANDTMSVRI